MEAATARPRGDDRAAWRAYWAAEGMEWRREPEIPAERQAELAARRAITPDEDIGVYPFAGMTLTRADLEWLLATHEDGRGPVWWAEEREKEVKDRRKGLDLRAADLRGADLSGLPLARTQAGLPRTPIGAKSEQEFASGAHFEGATLRATQLQNSVLYFTHFEHADAREADCEAAGFSLADLRDADFTGARLEGAHALAAHLERVNFTRIRGKGFNIFDAFADETVFREADLDGAQFGSAGLRRADFRGANLRGAHFLKVFGMEMVGARFEGADLTGSDIAGADLWGVTLFGEGDLGVAVPAPEDRDPLAWRRYWWGQGIRWRTEPPIPEERQRQLDERRRITPDLAAGLYPFKDLDPKLARADLEWLLATHEDGRGPVDWDDPTQRARWGLDLRAADLAKLDMSNLPLARARIGLLPEEAAPFGFPDPQNVASRNKLPLETKLTMADLRGTRLDGAVLDLADCGNAQMIEISLRAATCRYTMLPYEMRRADLRGAVFTYTQAWSARLRDANLEGADLALGEFRYAEFQGANLRQANLRQARIDSADFERADLTGADLSEAEAQSASFSGATLDGARLHGILLNKREIPDAKPGVLSGASLVGADLTDARLEDGDLTDARLDGANLTGTRLERANLTNARLIGARLGGVKLAGAFFVGADLAGADLRGVTLDAATDLESARLGDPKAGYAFVGGVRWDETDLKVLDWGLLSRLGEEAEALRPRTPEGQPKSRETRIREHAEAVRALLALAQALADQGLREEAIPLRYRARQLQRRLHALRGDGSRWLFLSLLEALTGYGYRLQRMIVAYLVVVLACALGYYLLGATGLPDATPLSSPDALLISITAFHGRVFSEGFHAGSPQLWITAVEAVAGVVLEGLFIAMLTQRFFGD